VKILLVSQAFPPFNASGAIRVGKLAEYLINRGHDLRVITAAPLPYPRTLSSDIPTDRIITTRSADPLAVIHRLWSSRTTANYGMASSTRGRDGFARYLLKLVAPLAIPEPQIGWYPSAVAAGRRLFVTWRPNVIYASALPFTAHIVAATLARSAHVPWIAEFRDHFAENPYANLPRWRAPIDRLLERRTVASAAACVTVSEPMAETLRRRHGKLTTVVLNGYDDSPRHAPSRDTQDDDEQVRIVYTGVIYPGRRDPSVLFAAVKSLGAVAERVHMTFYGQDLRGVAEAADRYGVSHLVRLRGAIAYSESLAAQQNADVLLQLLWNDPREAGVYTGKLFEYVGAGRPILAVGSDRGVAVDLIRTRGLGVAASDPLAIETALRRWIEEKRATGRVAGPSARAKSGLSRTEQFCRVDELLHELVGEAPAGVRLSRGVERVTTSNGSQS